MSAHIRVTVSSRLATEANRAPGVPGASCAARTVPGRADLTSCALPRAHVPRPVTSACRRATTPVRGAATSYSGRSPRAPDVQLTRTPGTHTSGHRIAHYERYVKIAHHR